MKKNQYEIAAIVNGRELKEYSHKGKAFVEAKEKSEYSLRVRNNSGKRVKAIISVDGICAISGKPASESDTGYIVNPWGYIDVKGFRIDDNNIASFKFDEGKSSYASLVENDFNEKKAQESPSANNGVIGVRIWEEKEAPPVKVEYIPIPRYDYPYNPPYRNPYKKGIDQGDIWCGTDSQMKCCVNTVQTKCASFDAHDGMACMDTAPDFKLGTSWGAKQKDRVTTVNFENGTQFHDLMIYYVTRDELKKMGLLDVQKAVAYPQAFGQFCKVPAGYKG
jgi:hypothetical protein